MKKFGAFMVLGVCCLVLSPQAWAEEVTRQLPFSRKVTLAVPKMYLFKMELCTDAACTDTAYAETQKILLKTTALNFNLGAGTVEPTSPAFSEVDFSQQYWLKISRSGAAGFVAMGPPSKLSVVPYALWSNQVEGVGAGVGTITGVYGGDGLSGSATTGAATLNVGAGSGIAVGADTVSIANGGVTSAHIQDGTVTSADIADNSVASADILDGAVTSAKIANGTVAAVDIATGGVTGANILDGTVTAADIATGGVTGANILDGTVTAADIATGGVTSANIQDGGVAPADVGFNYAASSNKGGAATTAVDSDSVDGRHAVNLMPIVRTSSGISNTYIQFTCTNAQPNGFVSITVPSSGTIIVEFDARIGLNHILNVQDFGYLMVGTSASDCSSPYDYRGFLHLPASYGNNFNVLSVHVTRPFSVSAGTYTYYMNGMMSYGAPDDYFQNGNMKAVFYPNEAPGEELAVSTRHGRPLDQLRFLPGSVRGTRVS